MTEEQAKMLLKHQDEGNVVVFNGGPYISKAGTSNITDDLIYSDETYRGFLLVSEDPDSFDVYVPIVKWWEQ